MKSVGLLVKEASPSVSDKENKEGRIANCRERGISRRWVTCGNRPRMERRGGLNPLRGK